MVSQPSKKQHPSEALEDPPSTEKIQITSPPASPLVSPLVTEAVESLPSTETEYIPLSPPATPQSLSEESQAPLDSENEEPSEVLNESSKPLDEKESKNEPSPSVAVVNQRQTEPPKDPLQPSDENAKPSSVETCDNLSNDSSSDDTSVNTALNNEQVQVTDKKSPVQLNTSVTEDAVDDHKVSNIEHTVKAEEDTSTTDTVSTEPSQDHEPSPSVAVVNQKQEQPESPKKPSKTLDEDAIALSENNSIDSNDDSSTKAILIKEQTQVTDEITDEVADESSLVQSDPSVSGNA
ncbi:hypothetical protein BGZ49_005904, partial [Haplosporangium sp. Z 27]